jgi:hypothetical protein
MRDASVVILLLRSQHVIKMPKEVNQRVSGLSRHDCGYTINFNRDIGHSSEVLLTDSRRLLLATLSEEAGFR